MTDSSSGVDGEDLKLDSSVAHSARVWDYWLGGKDNYAADREAGDQIRGVLPDVVEAARVDLAFLNRAVRYLAGEAGIRQFLDVGTGLPTANNTHEVAQSVTPDSRIVYVDNDPIVLAHAVPCWSAPRREQPTTSTRTCTIPARSCGPPPGPWTSVSRSGS